MFNVEFWIGFHSSAQTGPYALTLKIPWLMIPQCINNLTKVLMVWGSSGLDIWWSESLKISDVYWKKLGVCWSKYLRIWKSDNFWYLLKKTEGLMVWISDDLRVWKYMKNSDIRNCQILGSSDIQISRPSVFFGRYQKLSDSQIIRYLDQQTPSFFQSKPDIFRLSDHQISRPADPQTIRTFVKWLMQMPYFMIHIPSGHNTPQECLHRSISGWPCPIDGIPRVLLSWNVGETEDGSLAFIMDRKVWYEMMCVSGMFPSCSMFGGGNWQWLSLHHQQRGWDGGGGCHHIINEGGGVRWGWWWLHRRWRWLHRRWRWWAAGGGCNVNAGGGLVVVIVGGAGLLVVAIVDSGGGCIDAGSGVRWWCGHIDDGGGGWVVVVASSTQAVGWLSSSMEVLGWWWWSSSEVGGVVVVASDVGRHHRCVDDGGGEVVVVVVVVGWGGGVVVSTTEVVGGWWWSHRWRRCWAGRCCWQRCWADGGGGGSSMLMVVAVVNVDGGGCVIDAGGGHCRCGAHVIVVVVVAGGGGCIVDTGGGSSRGWGT